MNTILTLNGCLRYIRIAAARAGGVHYRVQFEHGGQDKK